MREKMQVVWSASTPEYIGVGDSMTTKYEQGVQEFEVWDVEQINSWLEDMSVGYGEQGGNFDVMGFWYGEKDDLVKGVSRFKSGEVFFRNHQASEDSMKEDIAMNEELEAQSHYWEQGEGKDDPNNQRC